MQTQKKGMSGGMIALLVVGIGLGGILVLGLVAGVIGIAVSGVVSDTKVKNDAMQVGKFTSDLQIAMTQPLNQKAIAEIGIQPSFGHLVSELYKRDIVKYDSVKRLAGVSGVAGSPEDYKNPDDPRFVKEWCIFTGPTDVRDLLRLMNNKAVSKVMLCYNEEFIDAYPDEGIVIVVSGTSEGQFIAPANFESVFGGTPTRSSYGEGAFESVAPK